MRRPAAETTITTVGYAREERIGRIARSVIGRVRRPASARPGLVVLGLGAATLLAGGYRGLVERSDGRLRALVPVAVDAPLASELLVLVAVVVIAAGLLIVASYRRRPLSAGRDAGVRRSRPSGLGSPSRTPHDPA